MAGRWVFPRTKNPRRFAWSLRLELLDGTQRLRLRTAESAGQLAFLTGTLDFP
ncbi:uncharacterized protein PHALS_00581 [Plasmopara halstedii]|uniref:Uncharacterized protein n=1 Tax=Plasmopara halstedii TaxID=4781 RepID=A0A0P1AUR1_PLAHL|nr:uncharacterized protein PHALS_00581 [Plasmopara halstedii]CEG44294.1 hypothetical protein PHALS_00581 [Plasmopara halstedii]|eukprot:XP_024580663.1 hypothetical protein PHALS_00581 [Plasmopara halstedii]